MSEKEKLKYVWVCELCLRVVSDEFNRPDVHATYKGSKKYCSGNWIRKPIK